MVYEKNKFVSFVCVVMQLVCFVESAEMASANLTKAALCAVNDNDHGRTLLVRRLCGVGPSLFCCRCDCPSVFACPPAQF